MHLKQLPAQDHMLSLAEKPGNLGNYSLLVVLVIMSQRKIQTEFVM